MEGLSLFLTVFLALVIPIVMARLRVTTVPTAVAEIIVGILMGKSCLNLITQTFQLAFLSNLGVIILMFLSGMEIDFDLLSPKKHTGPEVRERQAGQAHGRGCLRLWRGSGGLSFAGFGDEDPGSL